MAYSKGRYVPDKGQQAKGGGGWKGGGGGGATGGGWGAGSGGGFPGLEEDRTDLRIKEARDNDTIDSKYGFDRWACNWYGGVGVGAGCVGTDLL